MTIYSLTPFFNERDVLEIKLREQASIVDVFVISEATTTYAGTPKPIWLESDEAKERLAPWADQIRLVVVDDAPALPGIQHTGLNERWARENHQRRALIRGVPDLEPDDVILLSDLDEIVRPGVIEWYCREADLRLPIQPHLPMHLFYLNLRWRFALPVIARLARGAALLPAGTFWDGQPRGLDVEQLRQMQCAQLDVPRGGPDPLSAYGWHLAYMGGNDAVRHKVREAAHPELEREQYLTDEWLDACKIPGTGYELFGRTRRELHYCPDGVLPLCVQQEPWRWQHMRCGPHGQPLGAEVTA